MGSNSKDPLIMIIPVSTPPIASLFLAAHHAGSPALWANKFPLFVGGMGNFTHFNLAPAAIHWVSSLGAFGSVFSG